MQEIELRSFQIYCITLRAHFVKKQKTKTKTKTLKSDIIYNSGSRVISTHLFPSVMAMQWTVKCIACNINKKKNCLDRKTSLPLPPQKKKKKKKKKKHLGLVSQKSRNFSGVFRVPQLPFISSQLRGSKPSNFAIFLVFPTLKTS